MAKHEAEVAYRNQIFVALTRSRGWVHTSGCGDYSMFEELQAVIRSGERLRFLPNQRV